ncbi:MAG: Orf2 family protein [Verrucomicrobia bacterium]|nr:Orf2 family protein [Verrucomicrobiota bacterium]
MIQLGGVNTLIHLAIGAVDLRRGYSRLFNLIEQHFGGEPLSGHLWVFLNKQRSLVKILWWDTGGVCVLAKRLHEGTFQSKTSLTDKVVMLTAGELQMLLEGLDLAQLRPRRWVRKSPIERMKIQPETDQRCGSSSAMRAAG